MSVSEALQWYFCQITHTLCGDLIGLIQKTSQWMSGLAIKLIILKSGCVDAALVPVLCNYRQKHVALIKTFQHLRCGMCCILINFTLTLTKIISLHFMSAQNEVKIYSNQILSYMFLGQ